MNLRVSLFLATILAASPLFAREKSDVIAMKNGDKITCEIKGLHSDTLYISVDYILSTLSVDWTKVDHIDSKQLFVVTTQDGTVYIGTISTPKTEVGRPLQIDVWEAPEKRTTLERTQITTVDETSPKVRQRWNGQIGLGFSHTKGNQSSQYNLKSDIGYTGQRWSGDANYTSNLTSSTGANISTRNELSVSAKRLIRWNNNWYYTGLVNLLQSSVQGIQLQGSYGGGVGRNVKNTSGVFLTTYGGFAWQQINYQKTIFLAPTQQVTAGLLGAELRLFQFDKTTLTINANLLPAISDPGRVFFNLNTSYYVKLWGKLNWNFSFGGNLDNHPPPGYARSDYTASSGLSVSFSTH